MVRRRNPTREKSVPRERSTAKSKSVARAGSRSKSRQGSRKLPIMERLKNLPPAMVPARVYKRWIFLSVVLTLAFSWLSIPYWMNTQMMPEKLGQISEYFFESALAKILPRTNLFGDDFLGNITSILKPFWQSEAEQNTPGKILRRRGVKAKHPVVIIPGITSTGLELWEGFPCAQSYFRQRLWGTLSMMRFMVMDSACWMQHLKLNSTTGNDPDNIKVRPAQGLEAADFILPGFWVWAPIIENLAEIGYDHNNLIMAPYDWRLDLIRLEERDHYFSRLKSQIELLVKTKGEKVVIVSHSLGGNVWFYFMKWVESKVNTSAVKGGAGGPDWVANHIHASVSIGAPYLGVPKSLSMILSGEMRDTAQLGQLESFLLEMLMSKKERLSLFRTWVGGFSILPKGGDLFWGNGTKGSIVDASPEMDYGLLNMDKDFARDAGLNTKYLTSEIFTLLKTFLPQGVFERIKTAYSDGSIASPSQVLKNEDNPLSWSNPLQAKLPNAPKMTMYCIYGVGRDTERAYEYETVPRDQWPEEWQNLTEKELKFHQSTDDPADLLVRIRLHLEAAEKSKKLYTGIYHVDGDGTVPTLSNGYMCAYGWKNLTHLNPSKMKIVAREYEDDPVSGIGKIRGGPRTSEHVDILGNFEVTMDFLKIASGWEEEGPVEERIFSDIMNMARKIKIPFL